MATLSCDVIGCFERAVWRATGHADMPALDECLCAYHHRRVCKMQPKRASLYCALPEDTTALTSQERCPQSEPKFHPSEYRFGPCRGLK